MIICILKVIAYFFYMVGAVFKTVKLKFLKRFSTEERWLKYRDKSVYNWAKFTVDIVGLRLNVEGKENIPRDEACLYVSNHQSNLDIPSLIVATGVIPGFIAKEEMRKVPVLSTWMSAIHSVFMDRKNVRKSLKSILEGVNNLKNGYNMCIFPEGTRSKSSTMGEFKKGSMKLATKANVKVVPVTINGTYKAWEGNEKKIIGPADVSIRIHKPIDVSKLDKEQKNNLTEMIKEVIQGGIVLGK